MSDVILPYSYLATELGRWDLGVLMWQVFVAHAPFLQHINI